jgi:hypothetical protein
MRYNHNFFTVILRKYEFISLPNNKSVMYIKDASSVSTWLESLWHHFFLFRLDCSAVGNIRLLMHEQIVHPFHNRTVQCAVYQGRKFCEFMICWQPGNSHNHNHITYFYLVCLPCSAAGNIRCYINKGYIHFITQQCKPQHNQVTCSLSRDQRK